ncbi:hypothetical protein [Vibrio maerlii]|uniref:hypothetical protein n=1 Tax=Vibrio maerlii TaxID=2231648 RepID=UPI000F4EBFB1|nr:hypothetical protein [Vibrio maerlii]
MKLYKKNDLGALEYEAGLKDTYYKCSTVFNEAKSDSSAVDNVCYRIDLLSTQKGIIACKVIVAGEKFTLPS